MGHSVGMQALYDRVDAPESSDDDEGDPHPPGLTNPKAAAKAVAKAPAAAATGKVPAAKASRTDPK